MPDGESSGVQGAGYRAPWGRRAPAFVFVAAALAWAVDAVIDSIVFGSGRLPEAFLADSWHELYMRLATTLVVAGLALVTQVVVVRTERLDAARREADWHAAEVRRLGELNRFKSEFINTIAHELNTPLTPIKIQLYLLAQASLGSLTTKQRRALEVVQFNADRLASFLGQLLDAARLERGRLRLSRSTFDWAPELRRLVAAFEAEGESRGVRVEARIPASVRLTADRHRIGQVVANLLSNALKFTPAGGQVGLEVSARNEEVFLEVRDTGVGVRADQLGRLFQPFTQLDGATQESHSGTGLGLFICRGIVEEHGGRIWCQSAGPGAGSSFFVAIPLGRPSDSAEPKAVAGASPEEAPPTVPQPGPADAVPA